MITESHTDPDHHAYGVRGRVVQALDCASRYVGSSPIARPDFISFEFVGESFAQPDYPLVVVGPAFTHAAEADLVRKRWTENPEVSVRFRPAAPKLKM